MAVMYGELLWPRTNLKPGDNRNSGQNHAWLTWWEEGWVDNLSTFTASNAVMRWNKCTFFNLVSFVQYKKKISSPSTQIRRELNIFVDWTKKKSFLKTLFKPEEEGNQFFSVHDMVNTWYHKHFLLDVWQHTVFEKWQQDGIKLGTRVFQAQLVQVC